MASQTRLYDGRNLVSLCSGVTLITVLSLSVDTMTVWEGWLIYIGGAMISALSAGALASDESWFSWGAATFGFVLLAALLFTGAQVPLAATALVAVCGVAVIVLSGWSAASRGRGVTRAPSRPATSALPAK